MSEVSGNGVIGVQVSTLCAFVSTRGACSDVLTAMDGNIRADRCDRYHERRVVIRVATG